MSIYKIVRKGQFAYGPVTSRNGDKVSIALLEEEKCIISSSYSVFEIINTKELLPEYLNLWFKRPEFDRYARFHSHGSAREIFDWEEMCNVELPVPEIEEQRKIVEAYNTIERRIALKRKINDNIFKVVNQVEIQGKSELRIPDAIVYINGLPMVVIEFKSATRENSTIFNAYEQLTVRYTRDIPDLFKYNAFVVISDGVNNKYGSIFQITTIFMRGEK